MKYEVEVPLRVEKGDPPETFKYKVEAASRHDAAAAAYIEAWAQGLTVLDDAIVRAL